MFHFSQLTTYDWVTDAGFRHALALDPGTITFAGQVISPGRKDIVAYWQHEKDHYQLWELLLYMSPHTLPQTLQYFRLPADTAEFLRWVYNHVAHEQRELFPEGEQDFFGGGFAQMKYFPYEALYTLWQRETDAQRAARRGNVLVYQDRLTEPTGELLLALPA